MKNLYSKLMVAAVMFAISSGVSAQSSEFQTAFFGKDLVNKIISQRGCTGLRMYPAINRSSNTKSAMIVAIDANGNELYSGNSSASKYQMFTGVRDNNATYASLSKSDAVYACDAYFSSNESFTSEISKKTVEALLSGNSNGIAIRTLANQNGNFVVSGYTQNEGLKVNDGAKPGDPCPSACGEPRQYLAFPKSTH